MIGDGEAVIAGGGSHHPAPLLLRGELQEHVGRAPLLEGARHLQVLELDEDACAREARERLGVRARCDGHEPLEALARGADVVEGRVGQNGRKGAEWPGDIRPTGMRDVDWAQPT